MFWKIIDEKEMIEKQKEYDSNNLVFIRNYTHRAISGTDEKGLKTWSEIVDIKSGKTKVDNRTAKQIEEDTLNLFKG